MEILIFKNIMKWTEPLNYRLYENLNTTEWVMMYCKVSDINIRKINHSKPKNNVMNRIHCSDINQTAKNIFIFLYDLKSQQKYLAWIYTNQKTISVILDISESVISNAILIMKDLNLIIEKVDRFGSKFLIPNEDYNSWNIDIDPLRLSKLEEIRKHCAWTNKQLTDEYKLHKEK